VDLIRLYERRQDRIILASGPVLGAAVGAITNVITSGWNWWLFVALVLAISLAAAGAAVSTSPRADDPPPSEHRRSPTESISTLPVRAGIFVGRDRELSRFSEQLILASERTGRPIVFLITDGPGSGKTALATQAAHQLSPRYPDARLYLGFRSYSGEASSLSARDALVDALAAISPGTPLGALDTDQLTARWRSETSGRRMLLVLDDVASLAQAAPMLPNSSDCVVIVTSRLMIPGLDADVHIELGGLAADDAARMIRQITQRASQVVDDTLIKSLAQVYTMPLSVRHVADQLVTGSVDRLRVMMPDRDPPIDPAAMFRATIRSLTGTEQLVLRRTALYPGPHASAAAVGVLANISTDEAEDGLARLHARGIIGKPDPYGYQFHDLVRAVALEYSDAHDTEDDRNRARYRLFTLTADVLDELNALINTLSLTDSIGNSGTTVGEIADDELSALSWFERYFEDLRAVTRLAIHYEWPETWRLASGLAYFMRIRQDIPQAIEMINSALQITLARGDDLGRAVSLIEIGILHRAISSYARAEEYVKSALPLFKARDDILGEASCHLELGNINHLLSRFQDALSNATIALPLFERTGNMRGIADAKGALGMINRLLGNYSSARSHLDYALTAFASIGSVRNQAWILIELGTVDQQTGDYEQAGRRFAQAREIYHDADDRNGCAWADRELGIVSRVIGNYSEAEILLGQSLATFTEIGSKRNIADASIELATLHRITANLDKAHSEAALALQIYLEIRNVRGAAWAELELSAIERLSGSPSSIRRLERLLASYKQIGDRSGLARTYHELGTAAITRGDITVAREHLQTALSLYQEIGSTETDAVSAGLAALSP
jgi:tetratricopeptide (TPR) repeat protein